MSVQDEDFPDAGALGGSPSTVRKQGASFAFAREACLLLRDSRLLAA